MCGIGWVDPTAILLSAVVGIAAAVGNIPKASLEQC